MKPSLFALVLIILVVLSTQFSVSHCRILRSLTDTSTISGTGSEHVATVSFSLPSNNSSIHQSVKSLAFRLSSGPSDRGSGHQKLHLQKLIYSFGFAYSSLHKVQILAFCFLRKILLTGNFCSGSFICCNLNFCFDSFYVLILRCNQLISAYSIENLLMHPRDHP